MLKSKRVFILAPHPDDAEIACGGTIARLIEGGSDVFFIVFSVTDIRQKELIASAKMLGVAKCFIYGLPIRNFDRYRQVILDKLISLKAKMDPDLVIQPSLTDIHQDHQVIAQEGLRAFKNTNLLGYEALWNNINFDAQLFVSLEDRHLRAKLKAVKCYESQADKAYMDRDYIESLMKVRGVQIGFKYAEMFSVIRQVVR
jgi:LmbE family N-acetylglucosaminyl deacetylase